MTAISIPTGLGMSSEGLILIIIIKKILNNLNYIIFNFIFLARQTKVFLNGHTIEKFHNTKPVHCGYCEAFAFVTFSF